MILVTGATGLVGSHLLVQLLQENEAVKALYRSKEQIEKVKNVFAFKNQTVLFDKINWVKGDITDIPTLEIAFEHVTHVYHCAALISFDPSDEAALRKINIEGTANVVNCCIAFGIKKLCHVSSIAALGSPKDHEVTINEQSEWNPEELHSDYAITKYGAEMEVWRGQQEGLKVLIVNPGVIFGPCFWNQGSGAFFTTVKKGIPFFTYDWKKEIWNLLFVLGTAIGGFIAVNFLANPETMVISQATQADLMALGITDFTDLMPLEIFNWETVFTGKGILFFVIGGFLVGFGTRYAGGCTSGHAIMGISSLQWPSLVATIFFMLGGFFMTHVLLEPLMKLVGF